jgi:hypothetical protein
MALCSDAARLAPGALRSVRLVLRNRRNRAPVEIVANRAPIRISHILVHNVRHGLLNWTQPSPLGETSYHAETQGTRSRAEILVAPVDPEGSFAQRGNASREASSHYSLLTTDWLLFPNYGRSISFW